MLSYLVEFLGTLFFTFVIFSTNNYLAVGAALSIVILIGSSIENSVRAFNPAIAMIQAYAGKLPQKDLVPYILAQIAGSLAGLELSNMVLHV